MTNTIPEGFEPAEVSAAKDIVQDELDTAQVAGDIHDEADIIRLADIIVTRLLKAGVTIPETIEQPLMVGFHKVSTVEDAGVKVVPA